MESWEADRVQWGVNLEMFQERLAKALDRDSEAWQDENATDVTKKAASLLGIKPGDLNGYLEVWTELFSVMEFEDALVSTEEK